MLRQYRISQMIVAGTFCGLISLPIVTGSWSGDVVQLAEKRRAAAPPQINLARKDLRRFFEQSERYFNDRFGLRQELIEWYSRLQYHVFGASSSEDVIVGKDGWLFWAQKGDGDPIAYFRGVKTLTADDVSELTGILQARSDWMEARGVAYLFLVAPNKETIYPEFMPDAVTRLSEESHLGRFMNYAADQAEAIIVDPRERLLDAKRHLVTYHRTDTHWNAFGAYAAYLEVMDVVRARYPEVSPLVLTPQDFRQEAGAWPYVVPSMRLDEAEGADGEATASGDLAAVLGLQRLLQDFSVVPKEPEERCARLAATPYRPKGWEEVAEGPHPSLGHKGLLTTTCEGRPLHVLVMHNSFGPLLIPFLSETFGRVTYVWADDFWLAKDFVENSDLDILIHVHVERHLLPNYIY